MSRPIGLAAQTVPGIAPWQTIEIAAAAGFAQVGIIIDPDGWGKGDTARVRAALHATGLILQDVEVIRLHAEVTPAMLRLLDIAADLGAAHVITVSFSDDAARTMAMLDVLADHAKGSGSTPILEFGRFTGVGTLGEALSIARRCGVPILLDPLHLARSGGGAVDLAGVPDEMMPYAQLCDAGPPPADADRARLLEEARGERLDIGAGLLDLDSFVRALPASVPLMNEVRSHTLDRRFSDPFAHARHLATTMRAWLQRTGESE